MHHLITCHGRIMPRLAELLFTVLKLRNLYKILIAVMKLCCFEFCYVFDQ